MGVTGLQLEVFEEGKYSINDLDRNIFKLKRVNLQGNV